jgi:alcohol dehydrogenase (cytochrome c)
VGAECDGVQRNSGVGSRIKAFQCHGRMFITTPGNNVVALDARTGSQLWRYVKKYPEGLFQLHPTNRGVALYGDRVYMATTDCQLVALEAATGKEAWSVPIDDFKTGCYATLAPLAVRGKILVGYRFGATHG